MFKYLSYLENILSVYEDTAIYANKDQVTVVLPKGQYNAGFTVYQNGRYIISNEELCTEQESSFLRSELRCMSNVIIDDITATRGYSK